MTATLEPRPTRRLQRPASAGGSGRATKLVAGATALVVLISSGVALGFTLRPSMKPDPRDEAGASALVLAVERNVTVEEWLQRTSVSREDLLSRRAAWQRVAGSESTSIEGPLAYVRISLKGYKRKEVRVRWSIYRTTTLERLDEGPAYAAPTTTFKADAPSDTIVLEQPLPPETGPDRYFARFEIRTPDGTLLEMADSKPFRGQDG